MLQLHGISSMISASKTNPAGQCWRTTGTLSLETMEEKEFLTPTKSQCTNTLACMSEVSFKFNRKPLILTNCQMSPADTKMSTSWSSEKTLRENTLELSTKFTQELSRVSKSSPERGPREPPSTPLKSPIWAEERRSLLFTKPTSCKLEAYRKEIGWWSIFGLLKRSCCRFPRPWVWGNDCRQYLHAIGERSSAIRCHAHAESLWLYHHIHWGRIDRWWRAFPFHRLRKESCDLGASVRKKLKVEFEMLIFQFLVKILLTQPLCFFLVFKCWTPWVIHTLERSFLMRFPMFTKKVKFWPKMSVVQPQRVNLQEELFQRLRIWGN